MKIRSTFRLMTGAVLLLGLAVPRALGQITVDEIPTPTPLLPAPGIFSDPFSPTMPPTVMYPLPFIVTPGDLAITEPPVITGQQFSDLLRWEILPATNQEVLFVYSDSSSSDPPNAPADVGIPPNFQANLFMTPETGLGVPPAPYTDFANGLVWVPAPGSGLPGSPPAGAAPITWTFISDVPEPAMLCLAPALVALLRRNRR